MSSGKIVLGVLAGLAAGALAGILFAPEKGSVTRKNIAHKGEDYLDELKEKFDDLVTSVTKKFDGMKQEAKDMMADGQAESKAEKK
jgi:gas vesicle protein